MKRTKFAVGLALAVGMVVATPGLVSAQRILVNELYRAGNLEATDEWIELLLIEDLTAAELNTFFYGDSTSTPNNKFGAYQFTNMGDIAATFPAGTLITAGGATASFAEDTSYDPDNGDWNIELIFGSTHITKVGSLGDFAATEVAWVDTEATGSEITEDGFGVKYGPNNGTLGNNASVTVLQPPNNTNLYVIGPDHFEPDDWAAAGDPTPGEPNGGENTDYIEALRRGEVLLIELESFTATAAHANSAVNIEWVTSSEIDSVGFNVRRARPADGGLALGALVNESLIPAQGVDGGGATYSLLDPMPAGDGPRAYFLIEVDANGNRDTYGPFRATVGGNPANVCEWSLY